MKTPIITMLTVVAVIFFTTPAAAQRGVGDDTGIARQGLSPPVVTMSGMLADFKIGPCEQTTGRCETGAHLIIQTKENGTVNLHLGPLSAVDHVIDQVTVGQTVSFEAFRTVDMQGQAYIAKALTLEDKVIELRDDNLRPRWAVSQRSGRGMRRGSRARGYCW